METFILKRHYRVFAESWEVARKNIFLNKNCKSLWKNDKLKKPIYREMRKVEGYQIDEEINNLKRRKIQEIS